MKKISLLLAILLIVNTYSQTPLKDFFTYIYCIPSSDSVTQLFYLYKIPTGDLIFSKNVNRYTASIQISVEVSDSNSLFIQRYFKDRTTTFEDFSLTLDPDSYIDGVISFPIENRPLTVTSRFYDLNSQKEIFNKEQSIHKIQNGDTPFLSPIILQKKPTRFGENECRVLSNYGGFIPFDNNSYDVLIPVIDTTLEKLYIKVIASRDTVYNGTLDRRELERNLISEFEGKIILSPDSTSTPKSQFYLTDLTDNLKEGPIDIIVSKSNDFQVIKSFRLIVKWLNKPRSLQNAETALRLLRFVIKDDSVKQILKSGDNYDSLLYKFWQKWDPSPNTQYNELMAQYYDRIDYSMNSFSTITGLSGLETDRAKIYIRYGKPTFVERGSNNDGKISETWIYSKLEQKFIFVDEKGTGEFILKNNL